MTITQRWKSLKTINDLTAMVRIKGRDNKAKIKFLARAISATKWELHARQRVLVESSFQRLTNALYTSMQELGTLQQQTTSSSQTMEESQAEAFRKSSWKRERKGKRKEKLFKEILLTELFNTFFRDEGDGPVTQRQ